MRTEQEREKPFFRDIGRAHGHILTWPAETVRVWDWALCPGGGGCGVGGGTEGRIGGFRCPFVGI